MGRIKEKKDRENVNVKGIYSRKMTAKGSRGEN